MVGRFNHYATQTGVIIYLVYRDKEEKLNTEYL